MPHVILLLLKINIVLLLFSVTYYLTLKKLTFYTANRIFLQFGILFSSTYPFIDLTAVLENNDMIPKALPNINRNLAHLANNGLESFGWKVLTILFYGGVAFMAARLFMQFLSLRKLHNSSIPTIIGNLRVRILKENVSPFSFWQTIYVNPILHNKNDLDNILAHERVHVKEWHTIDIILSELCLVFYWFNPGVWLMKKAVRENIEFITDARILNKGVDKKTYQYSLLQVGTLQPSVAFVSHFNLSDLKTRIVMMNRKRSASANLGRYLFAIPILLITLAFSVDKKGAKETWKPLQNSIVKLLPKEIKLTNFTAVKTIRIKLNKKEKLQATADRSTKVYSLKQVVTADSLTFVPSNATFNIDSGKISAIKIISGAVVTLNPSDFKTDERLQENRNSIGNGQIIIAQNSKFNTSMSYFVNGKEISSEQLKNLDTSRIASMKIDKANGSIHIITRD
jgi:hypothetical protein